MDRERINKRDARQMVGLGGLAVLLLAAVYAVFLNVRQLVNDEPPTPGVATAISAGTREVVSLPRVAPGVLPTPHVAGGHLVRYSDEIDSFSFEMLSIWRGVETGKASTADDDPPHQDPPRHLVFEHSDSCGRLTVTIWPDGGLDRTLRDWVVQEAPGMISVDGRWPANAVVGGEPAMLVWADELPDVPARYAAFIDHEAAVYRLAYAAYDGGSLLGEFARALVTLEWSDRATDDLIPPLPRPGALFFAPATLAAGQTVSASPTP